MVFNNVTWNRFVIIFISFSSLFITCVLTRGDDTQKHTAVLRSFFFLTSTNKKKKPKWWKTQELLLRRACWQLCVLFKWFIRVSITLWPGRNHINSTSPPSLCFRNELVKSPAGLRMERHIGKASLSLPRSLNHSLCFCWLLLFWSTLDCLYVVVVVFLPPLTNVSLYSRSEDEYGLI